MATKSITITTEAYDRLAALKGPKESFSDVINRIAPRPSLRELAGALTAEEADELEAHLEELWKRWEA